MPWIQQKPSTFWFIASLSATLVWVGGTFVKPEGWAARQRLQSALQNVRTQNQQTQERIDALRSDVEALRTRKEVQEHAVRDVLGWVRPHDLIIHLDERP